MQFAVAQESSVQRKEEGEPRQWPGAPASLYIQESASKGCPAAKHNNSEALLRALLRSGDGTFGA